MSGIILNRLCKYFIIINRTNESIIG